MSPAFRDYAEIPDVALVPFDTAVTELDVTSGSTTMQSARVDPDRLERHAPRDADDARGNDRVDRVAGGGSSIPWTVHFCATDYTVAPNGPAAMPAFLRPNRAYTYALELSTDEARAAGSELTTLSQPALLYVENFLGVAVGENVPLGRYRYDKNS